MAPGVNAWVLLPSRLVLFAAMQALLAAAFALARAESPWASASRWWLFTAAAANGLSFVLLVRALGGEALRASLRFRRDTLRGDVKWLLASLVLAGPIAWLPNQALALVLWGDVNAGSRMMFQPMPVAACVVAAFVFTPLHALSELTTYFFAATPALERAGHARTRAVLISALFLGLQHCALPLLFDAQYLAWRAAMFLPFAVAVGFLLRWRPTLLPYFVVLHLVMDAQLPVLTALVSTGLITM